MPTTPGARAPTRNPRHYIEKSGGKVLTRLPVPLDTKDFVPYLAQIPADTEVLLPAFIGSLSVAFYTQAKAMGLDKKMKMYLVVGEHRSRSRRPTSRGGRRRLFLREFSAAARRQERRVPQGVHQAHGDGRGGCPRDRRPARHGQEPRLAGLGGYLRHQAGGRKRPATRRARMSKASSRRSKACR